MIENDNITIKIPENTYKLKIESSKAVQTGKIDFKITKAITEKEYTRDEIKTLTGIENRVTVNEEIILKNINLKETTTEANFEINAQSLKAGENKNIQIKATLLASDESQDLYKNTTLKITFPSKATNVEAPYKTLYANGLEVKNVILKEEDGRKVLFVEFEGEQKEYFGKAIDGTVLLVNANITMDKLMTNGEDNITLEYTNENANNYAVQNPSNPTSGTITRTLTTVQAESFIVTNKIAELDVDTTGKEEDKQVEIKSGEGTTNATVEIGGINNEGETLQNVKILGRFPTKNTTNTMDITLTSGIELTTSNENVKIYYSTKEDATEDLTDVNNGWTEDSTLEGKTSYLIVIPSLEDKAVFGARYGIRFSQSENYGNAANEYFKVIYKNSSNEEVVADSTNIVFQGESNLDIKMEIHDTEETDTIIAGHRYKAYIKISNLTNKDIENIKVVFHPNEYLQPDETKNKELNENNSITISKIESGKIEYIFFYVKCLGKIEDIEEATIYATVEINGISYNSNVIKKKVRDMSGNIKIEARSEKKDKDNMVEIGEKIYYTIIVKNTGGESMEDLEIKDFISKYVTINSVRVNGDEFDFETEINEKDFNVINIRNNLKSKDIMEIEIETTVNKDAITDEEKAPVGFPDEPAINKDNDESEFIIENYAKATNIDYSFAEKKASNFYIKKQDINSNTNKNEEKAQSNENINIEDINNEDKIIDIEDKGKNEKNNEYKIEGNVWIDENNNGYRLNNSKKISGINIYLIDPSTGGKVKDKNGVNISAQTNENGEYKLENIPIGEYIEVFEYDIKKYSPTEYQKLGVEKNNNSDAVIKNITIEGEEKKVAATDVLYVDSDLSNIDLGLIEIKYFDLELTKTIDKISVTNSEETKVYNFNNSNLAKVEIEAKKLKDSNVQIEYVIKIKNNGDVSSYVRDIVDYKPSDLDFDKSLNSDWYQEKNDLHNKSLANEKIEVGETKEVKLILTKTMTEANTGLISNIAEIAESVNNLGILDQNSIPGNQNAGENDMGQADAIIGVKTGKIINYILLTLLIFIIIGCNIYLLKRNSTKKIFK